jgi:hypothetical protein
MVHNGVVERVLRITGREATATLTRVFGRQSDDEVRLVVAYDFPDLNGQRELQPITTDTTPDRIALHEHRPAPRSAGVWDTVLQVPVATRTSACDKTP